MRIKWRDASTAPDDVWPVAIAVTVLCECARGARMVVTGARHNGEWVMDCEHSVEITHYALLPEPPKSGTGEKRLVH